MKEQAQSSKPEADPGLGMSSYNKNGEEVVNSTPMAIPVGFRRPISLAEKMKALLRSAELERAAEAAGAETFDDADDFDVNEGDPLDGTPYEDDFDPERPGAIAREQELRAGYVQDIQPEKKAKAREVIEKHKKKPAKPVATEQAQN